MLVINFYAGPGAGKSTTAALTYGALKRLGVRAELVTEVAKDWTWEHPGGKWQAFQPRVSAEQAWRLRRLLGEGVEVAVTDSPVLLGLAYCDATQQRLLRPWVEHEYLAYSNLDIFIQRTKPYAAYGRTQDEEQAIMLDDIVSRLLHRLGILHLKMEDSASLPETVAKLTLQHPFMKALKYDLSRQADDPRPQPA